MASDSEHLTQILDMIQDQARREAVRVTQHAHQEMVEEDFTIDEVLQAVIGAEILENYPEHRRGSCCLLNGTTPEGRPIHVVCTTTQPILIIITVYEPVPPKWPTPTRRR